MKYSFFDRDYFTNDGCFAFSREHYAEVLRYCFANSTVFSLQFMQSTGLSDALREWEIENPGFPYQNESHPENRHYYRANKDTHNLLLQHASSIFDFCSLQKHPCPEDLVFYRSDGTVVLDSIAHEGECNIYPRAAEEVAAILGYGHWLLMENGDCFEEGKPVAPAKEHQLPPSEAWNLFADPLYQYLVELSKSSIYMQGRLDIHDILSLVEECIFKNQKALGIHLQTHGPVYIPRWWPAFCLYVLGVCDATTNMDIPDALKMAGHENKDACCRFFELFFAFAKSYSDWIAEE